MFMMSRFARVPAETIRTCVDRLELQVSEEASSGLAEDTSFRIRQIADSACQFMRHSKRRRLTVDDVEKAMKYSGTEPVYGHHSDLPGQYGSIMLEQLALAYLPLDDHTLPNHVPLVTAAWQVVEGVELGDSEVLQGAVQVTQKPSEPHQAYLSLLLEAVTGEDEDKRRIALEAVQSKPAVANILPSLIQYLQITLTGWEQLTPSQLLRVLKLSLAVLCNAELFLDPYCPSLFPLLRDILLSPSYLSEDGEMHHWHVRQLAAAVMAQLIKRCGSPLGGFYQELTAHFQQLFSRPQQSSLPVLCGAVQVLCNLGYASVAEILFPHLEALVGFIHSASRSTAKNDVSRLQEAILVAARVLLTSNERSPPPLAPLPSCKLPGDPDGPVTTRSHSPHSSVGAEVTNNVVTTHRGGGGESNLFGNTGTLGFSAVVDNAMSAQEPDAHPSHKEPSSSSSPSSVTLYEYLVDLIGEGLVLSLLVAGDREGNPDAPTTPHTPKPEPPNKDSNSTTKEDSRFLETFLSREGFRAFGVQLPRKPAPPPSVPRGYYRGREPWTFHFPRSALPVRDNALEQRQSPSHDRSVQPVVRKGRCSGHHRYYRQQGPVNMASSWI